MENHIGIDKMGEVCLIIQHNTFYGSGVVCTVRKESVLSWEIRCFKGKVTLKQGSAMAADMKYRQLDIVCFLMEGPLSLTVMPRKQNSNNLYLVYYWQSTTNLEKISR